MTRDWFGDITPEGLLDVKECRLECSVAGKASLSRADVEPSLKLLKIRLMGKNVVSIWEPGTRNAKRETRNPKPETRNHADIIHTLMMVCIGKSCVSEGEGEGKGE